MGPARASSITVLLTALGALALSTPGCSGKDPLNPGTKLGIFHVTAKLATTSCGQAPDPWEFDVRLNHDGSTLYWIQGGAPIQGIVDPLTASTQMKTQSTTDIRVPEAQSRVTPCSIVRSDVLAVTLASSDAKPAGDPALTKSFTGALTYGWSPTDGSDCSDQLTQSGGGFAALPCDVHYDVSGVFQSDAP